MQGTKILKQKSKKQIIGSMNEDQFKLRSKISDSLMLHTLLRLPDLEMKTKDFKKQYETSKME